MIAIKTAEGVFELDARIANMMGCIQISLQNNPNAPVDLSSLKLMQLKPIVDFCIHHGYVNPPPIRKPIPSGDLSACIPDKFDVEFINNISFEDLFELIILCDALIVPSLKELASARIAAEFKGKVWSNTR